MHKDNLTVNGMWVGNRLSDLEILTLKSFVAQGHNFNLWLYEELENKLPNGVQVKDANEIIPAEKIFRYKQKNQFGHGKGSVSGFSDIFRYRLLYLKGGWWVDMDVTCLKPLTVEDPYYFRPHHDLLIVGNVLKCPKESKLMLQCYEEAIATVDQNNTNWHKPIEILVKNVESLGLENFIAPAHSAPDRWDMIKKYLFTSAELPNDWWYIHWMNEEWRRKGLNKDDHIIRSAYGKLLRKHGLIGGQYGPWIRIKDLLRSLYFRVAR